MQFELNDNLYFVDFVAAEGRWYVFTPTDNGIQRIPVASDAPLSVRHFSAELPEEDKGRVN